jgi:hypothetical protein
MTEISSSGLAIEGQTSKQKMAFKNLFPVSEKRKFSENKMGKSHAFHILWTVFRKWVV